MINFTGRRMFRTIITSGISWNSCLSLSKNSLQALVKSTNCVQKYVHTSAAACVLEKDSKSKKDAVRQSERRKLVSFEDKALDSSAVDPDLYFPTQNTPDMLINGVRFVDLPIIHMSCTPNNTIMQLTDSTVTEFVVFINFFMSCY
ncbi:hypothetical protein LSH36_352g00031 [Paralvinella palmiformis]|uniref:Uncharacterized protein n=1 Tax=Paralvinella palmiformis TaxID=53620 RepID=A0AAD9JG20_9ANNE|nr:hypothetical protein LSH36_352g00031 [Paralvinella palmiformis]